MPGPHKLKKVFPLTVGVFTLGALLFSAPQDAAKQAKSAEKEKGAKKVEMAHPFYWAAKMRYRTPEAARFGGANFGPTG